MPINRDFKGKEHLSFDQEDEYLIKGGTVMNDYQNLIEQEGLNDEMQGGSGKPMSDSFSSNLSDGQHKKYSPKLKSVQITNSFPHGLEEDPIDQFRDNNIARNLQDISQKPSQKGALEQVVMEDAKYEVMQEEDHEDQINIMIGPGKSGREFFP